MRRLRELLPPPIHFFLSVLGADVLTAQNSAVTKRLVKRGGHPALVPLLAGVLAAGIWEVDSSELLPILRTPEGWRLPCPGLTVPGGQPLARDPLTDMVTVSPLLWDKI